MRAINKMKKEFGVYFWMHILLLIPAYTSFLFVDWKIILIVVILLQIQYSVLGGCILTHLEMGSDKNETFIWYYLRKIYPSLNPRKTKFVIRIIVPLTILVLGLLFQIKLGFIPIIEL